MTLYGLRVLRGERLNCKESHLQCQACEHHSFDPILRASHMCTKQTPPKQFINPLGAKVRYTRTSM